MNKVIWRLHRNQARFAAAAFAVVSIAIILSDLRRANVYRAALAACGGSWRECGFYGDHLTIYLVSISTFALPGLLGLFWGVPLVAKELEEGTHVLAWTQGITRARWIASNIGWALAASAVFAAAMSAVVTWWMIPDNSILGRLHNFDIQGFVPVAYCVFAVSLGIAAGVLFKRVLPALAATLGVLVAVRAAIAIYLRPHFLSPLSAPYREAGLHSNLPLNASVSSTPVVDASGHVVATGFASFPQVCGQAALAGNHALHECMTSRGFHLIAVFQPDSRFWAFQGIESAIFLVLAIPLVVLTYRRIIRRDA